MLIYVKCLEVINSKVSRTTVFGFGACESLLVDMTGLNGIESLLTMMNS